MSCGLQGKLRIGLAEQTVLQSVGQAFFMHQTPSKDQDTLMQRMEEAVDRVKQAYSTCPSYDKVPYLSSGLVVLKADDMSS